jgi:hypothetical protein
MCFDSLKIIIGMKLASLFCSIISIPIQTTEGHSNSRNEKESLPTMPIHAERWLVLSTQDTFGIQNYWRCIGNNQGKHQEHTQQEKQEGKQTSKARAWMARAWEFDATILQKQAK